MSSTDDRNNEEIDRLRREIDVLRRGLELIESGQYTIPTEILAHHTLGAADNLRGDEGRSQKGSGYEEFHKISDR